MSVRITKHFDYLSPFSAAENDDELARIAVLKYPKANSNLETSAEFFARMVEEFRKFEAWRVLGFATFEAFCEEKLNMSMDRALAIVQGVRALQAEGHKGEIPRSLAEKAAEAIKAAPKANRVGRPSGRKAVESTQLAGGGQSVQRLAARIKRDHPEIAKRVMAGEFKSVRAAAIAAGIVKVPTPIEKAVDAFRRLDRKDRAKAIKLIDAIWNEVDQVDQ